MSDTSQGPGWWLASDGRWYPPELWTGPTNTGPVGPAAQPTMPAYPGQGSAYGSGTADANYGYGRYAPQAQGAPYGQAVQRKTNAMAIASLVCSCAGIFLIGIPAVLGIIFGFVARSQIRRSHGAQGGGGMAMAGIIVGFAVLALVIVVLAIAADNKQNNDVVGVVTLATALR
jgi:hypothetical protein